MNDTELAKLLDEALVDLLDDKSKQSQHDDVKQEDAGNEKVSTYQTIKQSPTKKTAGKKKNKQDSPNKSTLSSQSSNSDRNEATNNISASLKSISEVEGVDEEMNKFFEELDARFKSGNIPFPPDMPDISPDDAKARIGESMPQILNMMQNLLSKELLLPALTDLHPKFEAWLEKNNKTLSESDNKKYTTQCSLIKQMIQTFDDTSSDDSQKFERNMALMESMQSLGSPPDELVVPEGTCSIM